MQEEYTDDKKLCEWLRANSSGIYRLTGFAADKIEQLKEELETLRASNRIKQANIELYQAQHIPEGYTARDSLDKFVESIGGYDSNAWHDYCADALYIKGFEAGRLSRMPVEPDSNIINAIKSVYIECGLDGHDESIFTKISTFEAKKIYKAMLSASQPKGDV